MQQLDAFPRDTYHQISMHSDKCQVCKIRKKVPKSTRFCCINDINPHDNKAVQNQWQPDAEQGF